MKRTWMFFALLFLIAACENKPAVEPAQTAPAVDIKGYKLEAIAGSQAQRAVKRDGEGKVIEEGIILNGRRNGAWLSYEGVSKFPTQIATYVDDVLNGPYFELGQNGQIQIKAFYKNNKLHGEWGRYTFSRPLIEAVYNEGQLDGAYREYNLRDGKVIKETNYKLGVLHGPMRFFNEKEELTVEYVYKDGERIGGGMK